MFANVYPFDPDGSTEALTALHLPIALWLVAVGVAYAGSPAGRQVAGRMDFIRFSGELFIYYVLIALGGGVLTAFMVVLFKAIGIDPEPFIESWLLPCGAAGAVVVASWIPGTNGLRGSTEFSPRRRTELSPMGHPEPAVRCPLWAFE